MPYAGWSPIAVLCSACPAVVGLRLAYKFRLNALYPVSVASPDDYFGINLPRKFV